MERLQNIEIEINELTPDFEETEYLIKYILQQNTKKYSEPRKRPEVPA